MGEGELEKRSQGKHVIHREPFYSDHPQKKTKGRKELSAKKGRRVLLLALRWGTPIHLTTKGGPDGLRRKGREKR